VEKITLYFLIEAMNPLFFYSTKNGEKNRVMFGLRHDPAGDTFFAEGEFGAIYYREFQIGQGLFQIISMKLTEEMRMDYLAVPETIIWNYCLKGFFLIQDKGEQLHLVAQSQFSLHYIKQSEEYAVLVLPTENNEYFFLNIVVPYTPATPALQNNGICTASIEMQKHIIEMMQETGKPDFCVPWLDTHMNLLLLESNVESVKHEKRKTHGENDNPEEQAVYLLAESIILGMDETWKLKRLSASVQMTTARMNILFKKYIGVSTTAFKIAVRVQRAKQLLTDRRMSIQEISVLVGYSNPNYFAALFRSKTGLSPSQFRKK
jgi:AraC-like DNA-binding protein